MQGGNVFLGHSRIRTTNRKGMQYMYRFDRDVVSASRSSGTGIKIVSKLSGYLFLTRYTNPVFRHQSWIESFVF